MELAMFPLGSVLFPHAPIPLHVFEPRYRVLVHECLENETEFGVVLIERGSEVGGGDVRFDLGTAARIVESRELADGRYVLVAVGTRRVRVEHWLDDDPYPRAEVEVLEERPPGPEVVEALEQVRVMLRRARALRTELGELDGPLEPEIDADPSVASFQLAAQAPIGPLDALALLRLDEPVARLDQLRVLLEDALGVLEARLRE